MPAVVFLHLPKIAHMKKLRLLMHEAIQHCRMIILPCTDIHTERKTALMAAQKQVGF